MSKDNAIDFQIDPQQLYVDQVENYLNQVGQTLKARDLPIEQSKQLVHLFVKSLDFGAHSSNSESHLEHTYYDLANHIIRKTNEIKSIFTHKPPESVEDGNRITLEHYFRLYFHNCQYCGTEFLVKYIKGDLSFCDEPIQLFRSIYTPPSKTECFKAEKIRVKITAQSDQMVFANDLRPFLKDQSLDFDDSINTPYGRIKAVRNFAEKGVICVSTGNCTVQLYQNKQDMIITNGCREDIDEYDYEEEIKAQSRTISAAIKAGKYKLKADISCGLWWLMGAPVDEVDMNKLKAASTSCFIMQVEKDAEYTIEFDSTPSRFKFYKLFKNT